VPTDNSAPMWSFQGSAPIPDSRPSIRASAPAVPLAKRTLGRGCSDWSRSGKPALKFFAIIDRNENFLLSTLMSIVHVKRHANGDISKILRKFTVSETVKTEIILVVIIFICAWILIDATTDVRKFLLYHRNAFKLLYVCVHVVIFWPICLAGIMIKCGLQGKALEVLIADHDGVRFRIYPELGTVPWASIDRFLIGEPHVDGIKYYGKQVVVAALERKEMYKKNIQIDDEIDRKLKLSTPFATVEVSKRVNVYVLHQKLEAMRRQMAYAS